MNQYLGKNVTVRITNQIGTTFKDNRVYLNNFGLADDIKAHILGEYSPLNEYYGKVIGILEGEKRELIVAKDISSFTKDQMEALLDYYTSPQKAKVLAIEYLGQHIRNSVRALIKSDDKYLFVRETYLEDEYYHLVGGGMNFLEDPKESLEREIKEELNSNLQSFKFINTISNIFSVDNIKAHEVMHLYECTIDKEIENGQLMTADIYTSELIWLDKKQIESNYKKILPNIIAKYILCEN